MATTYNNLYMDIRRTLVMAGEPSATLEARELMCFGTGKSRQELERDRNLYVPPEIERRVWGLMERHSAGEPIAYIIGEWEFYGLPLDISPDVLIPRPDTEILAREAIAYLRELGQTGRVLDLCAGSGCVGLAIAAQVPMTQVLLGEISDPALKICRQNIRRNALESRVSAMRMDALERPDRSLGEFSCLVCNPPYIPADDITTLDVSVRDYEPRLALDGGKDGLDFYRSVTEKWRETMISGGQIFFEIGMGQAEAVLTLMRAQGFGGLELTHDLHGIPRVVSGTLYAEI